MLEEKGAMIPNLSLPTIEDVIAEAYSDRQNKGDLLDRIGEEEARKFIGKCISMIGNFEEVSDYSAQERLLPKDAEEANKIKIIWVLSGPGYYGQPFKDDRYKDKPWARWMDRNRAHRGVWLARRLTELKIGQKLPNDPGVIKQAILQDGPYIIYNGRNDENREMRRALTDEKALIPPEKVFIMDEGIDNTVDQVTGFRLPLGTEMEHGDLIALVTHSPHALRTLHMIQRINELQKDNASHNLLDFPISDESILKISPVRTPATGLTEYATLEICGLLHYAYYDQTRPASKIPFPNYEY